MKKNIPNAVGVLVALVLLSGPVLADVTIVENHQPRSAIQVSPSVMAADQTLPRDATYTMREAETQRRRLREAVKDLALYLGKMSGAKIEVLTSAPNEARNLTPILIGDAAVKVFGPPAQKSLYHQGWRMVVSPQGIGLMGESAESATYAIYELLDRLGCRWFMPGELGEVVPQSPTIRLGDANVSEVPSTLARNIWYADADFLRRNRLTDRKIASGHALERYITPEQREQHPEWRAIINGKPHATRLKWSNPEVAKAIADAIIARLDKAYTPSISLSPEDGAEFDESDDKALDAGDFDPSMNEVSITDRYIVLCNRIAERVTQKYPDVQFGFLAYVQYTRPPVREKLHPNLVPEIAPISYCRAHAMTDTNICPSRPQLKPIVEGWGKAAKRVSYYNYMYHLAEVSVPYPMMHQMSEELPILYRNNVTFWQPETAPNFDTVLPGMWLSMRMAWNNKLEPKQVLEDLFTKFYGSSCAPMRRYWQVFDDAWTNAPAHSGGGWSYLRRFPPEVMKAARTAMDEALAAASTPIEYRRVKLFDESLRQFERFMQLRRDLSEGRLENLDLRSTQWLGTQLGLADEYAPNYAFGKVPWSPRTMHGAYFKAFFEATYLDAARLADKRGPYTLISQTPLHGWKYAFAERAAKGTALQKLKAALQHGEDAGWQKAGFDDTSWKTTNSTVDAWADMNLPNEVGTMWYRADIKMPKLPDGKKIFLWIAATDGHTKLYVNGQHVPYVNARGETTEGATSFTKPISFDITDAIKPNAVNQITIAGTHGFLNELGTGGLLGPVYFYREK